jgi:hypothetical protein
MSTYKDILSKMKYHLGKRDEGYNFPLFPEYNKVVGNIIPGVYTVIAGAPASGRTSFVDSNYVMNVLLQWYTLEDRPPLKIFYFSLMDDAFKKMQKLLCSWMMMVEGIRIDIPTLNSQPGRRYNINERDDVLSAMDDAGKFFEEVEAEGALEILDGRRPPSEIYSKVVSYMNDIGYDEPRKAFELKDDYKEGLVMLVVDSVEGLLAEADGYGRNVRDDLSRKMISHAVNLSERYKVNVVLVAPTDIGFTRYPKETIPLAKHLGIFSKNCHRGVIIYNPIVDRTFKFVMPGEDPVHYLSTNSNVFRMWYSVRNTEGSDVSLNRFYILPGSGYTIEHDINADVNDRNDVYDVLMESPSPYL